MIVDGKAIALRIYNEVANQVSHMDSKPHLTVFTCAPNFETQKYLSLKRKKAHEVGIGVSVIEFPSEITTAEVITSITHACMQTNGIIVQLPFPAHVDIATVLKAVPLSYDVDAVHYDGKSDRGAHLHQRADQAAARNADGLHLFAAVDSGLLGDRGVEPVEQGLPRIHLQGSDPEPDQPARSRG